MFQAIIDEQQKDVLIEELTYQLHCERTNARKDIAIVVHNQLEYIENCINSIFRNTNNFNILLWDNGSDTSTRDYLRSLCKHSNIKLIRSDDNLGFIIPNNRLAEIAQEPYLILLNSDTEVLPGWDNALLGYLMCNERCSCVGYMGGLLDENCLGQRSTWGEQIDYVCGWCMCVPQDIYNDGLFDEMNLKFAYGEDADFCLRLREKGQDLYSLHLNLVIHYGNATINEVSKKRDTVSTFKQNHLYLKNRHEQYLLHKRWTH